MVVYVLTFNFLDNRREDRRLLHWKRKINILSDPYARALWGQNHHTMNYIFLPNGYYFRRNIANQGEKCYKKL
jgi:hypothetical protein